MPTYDYECTRCSHRFDVFQNMTDDPIKTCPECSGPVRRLIGGGIGIIFKGSGFYSTDSRSTGTKSEPKAETAESTGGSNGEKKTDKSDSGDSGGGSGDKKSGDGKKSEKVSSSS